MRNFGLNAKYMLAQNNVILAYCVKILTNTSVLDKYSTTAPYDITIENKVYKAGDGLVTVEAPRLSSVVDRETYKIVYLDQNFELRTLLEKGLVGAKVTVFVVLFNSLDTIYGSVQPGFPYLNSDDIIIAYKGIIDTTGYTLEPSQGKIVVALECSSPMAALDLTRGFYTSREAMQEINPADTAFNQINEGSRQVSRLWGR